MDSVDLLAREDEFRKLNKQLEKRTESLLKEIENAMQKQDIFADFSHSLIPKKSPNFRKHQCATSKPDAASPTSFNDSPSRALKKTIKNNKTDDNIANKNNISKDENGSEKTASVYQNGEKVRCECCVVKPDNDSLQFLYAFVSICVKEKMLPEYFLKERASIENVCKCLSSKVKLLQEQVEKLQTDIKKRMKHCELHLSKQAELETERLTLLNKCNNLTASSSDAKNKASVLQVKLEEKDRLYTAQRSETDKLSLEVKKLRSQFTHVEAKCASLQDSIDSLTQQLTVSKSREKELREANRALSSSQQTKTQNLETKINTQNLKIQRQLSLIQNLRKQIALLTTDGAIKALEKEYCSFISEDH